MKELKKIIFAAMILDTLTATSTEIITRVFPADSKPEIRIRAISEKARKSLTNLKVDYIRDDGFFSDGTGPHPDREWQTLESHTEGDEIIVNVPLNGEHEHTLYIHHTDKKNPKKTFGWKHQIYSLKPDLFVLRPFKGNVHQHSKESDGLQSVEEHLLHARRAGFDFVSLTDHHKYEPSKKLVKAEEWFRTGLAVYLGEEMHNSFSSPILHSISLGATGQVGSNDPLYSKNAAALIPGYKKEFPEMNQLELQGCADAMVCYNKSRKLGGFIIYSHPYWKVRNRFHAPEKYNEFMLNHSHYDAVELFNSASMQPSLMISRWHEMALQGKNPPVVSVSDSHNVAGSDYRENYTVIFSPDCTIDRFREAVLKRFCVARGPGQPSLSMKKYMRYLTHDFQREFDTLLQQQIKLAQASSSAAINQTELNSLTQKMSKLRQQMSAEAQQSESDGVTESLLLGDRRMVQFAIFLEQDYWKRHDAICQRQYDLLQQLRSGDESVRSKIAQCIEELNTLRNNYYYKEKKVIQ